MAVNDRAAVYASPAVYKLARELGVRLRDVTASARDGRIRDEDVRAFVRRQLSRRVTIIEAVESAAARPAMDFSAFGPIERRTQSRLRQRSAGVLQRNWQEIPHVTNHDDADITALEAFRVALNREHEAGGVKFTLLALVIKASIVALKRFPEFNASLDGDALVLKRYFHIGFATDTPDGLLVPVIRDADRKGLHSLATEIATLATRARAGKLAPADMRGGSFTISSLGGVGGHYFTPIINAPEVAILGVGKARTGLAWQGGQAVPRLMLPLSLSWDHRAVDGAAAAGFNACLVSVLEDFRLALL